MNNICYGWFVLFATTCFMAASIRIRYALYQIPRRTPTAIESSITVLEQSLKVSQEVASFFAEVA